jgi:hypothetical protein
MRVEIIRHVLAASLLATTSALAYESEEPVKVDTRALQSHVAQQVEARAAEGAKELMEYLWFTRRIHHLWIDDVAKPAPDAVASNEPPVQLKQMATRTTGLR